MRRRDGSGGLWLSTTQPGGVADHSTFSSPSTLLSLSSLKPPVPPDSLQILQSHWRKNSFLLFFRLTSKQILLGFHIQTFTGADSLLRNKSELKAISYVRQVNSDRMVRWSDPKTISKMDDLSLPYVYRYEAQIPLTGILPWWGHLEWDVHRVGICLWQHSIDGPFSNLLASVFCTF